MVNGGDLMIVALLAVLVTLYLTVSAGDWISTWQSLIQADSALDVSLDAFLYLIRHVLLYVGLSKLVLLDWQTSSTNKNEV